MSLRLGDQAPDFEADTTEGHIHFHQWLGNSWAVLFSHPKDFTPICTTELGCVANMSPDFAKRGVKLIGVSVDPVSDHQRWKADILKATGGDVKYPMIGDDDLKVAKLYGMLPADAGTTSQGRTAADNQTVRNVFIIGPDKKIKAILIYPMSAGRNFDEVLRLVDALQITTKHKVATPVNWKPGEDIVISGSVSDADAKKLYPEGWKTLTPYMRVAKAPRD